MLCTRNPRSNKLPLLLLLLIPTGKWVDVEVKRKTTRLKVVEVDKPVEELLDVRNSYVTDHLIAKAQQYVKKYRPGETPAPVLTKQYKVILPETMAHFEEWILSSAMTEPLKMREKNVAARHVVGLKEPRYTTFPRYQKDCRTKNVIPLPRQAYSDLLGMREFLLLKQDDCMCAKCLEYGWRGIVQEKKEFFTTLRTLGQAIKLFNTKTDPVPRLSERLETAWNHMRTTYGQHLQAEDEIASHCLRRQLGHSCNKHLNTGCSHTRSDGGAPAHPVPWANVPQTAGNHSLGGRWDANCEVCDVDCRTGGGRTVSCKSMKCRYCCRSCCNDCYEKYYPSEGPDDDYKVRQEYICNKCSADVDLVRHQPGGCAMCDELEHLPIDLIDVVDKIEKVAGVKATKDLRFKAERLVQNFKDFKHHMARVAQQELHWPTFLNEMKSKKMYNMVRTSPNLVLLHKTDILSQHIHRWV